MTALDFAGQDAGPTGTILHIGAGLCRDLPVYLRAEPTAIVLVEPDPDRLADLEADIAAHPVVRVIPAAISRKSGKADLRQFNLSDMNSLTDPTGVLDIYPGLRQTGTIGVETLTPADLLERIEIDPERDNWLIVEAAGQEAVILRDLLGTGALEQFRNIVLRCGIKPLFKSGVAAAQLMQELTDADYVLSADLGASDPDWRHWHLRLDLTARRLRDLTVRAAELETERSALKTTLGERERALQNLRATLEALKVENASLTRDRDAQNAIQADLVKERDALKEVRIERDRALQIRQSAIDTLKSEQQATVKERDALAARLKELADVKAQFEDLEAQADSANQDLRIALRLQTMAASDLAELQARYAALLDAKQGQDRLLQTLTRRLTEASDYLHTLSQNAPATARAVSRDAGQDTPDDAKAALSAAPDSVPE